MEIFAVFNYELSKSTMAAMMDAITSTGDLPSYVLDRSFDSFRDESLLDVDDRNNDDVGELSDRARGETDTYIGIIFDHYSDVSDDESDDVKPEDELCTVRSMLDDVPLSEFDFCNPSTCKSLIGTGPVAMDVLTNIQINTSVIHV